jgi:hypothetical protein
MSNLSIWFKKQIVHHANYAQQQSWDAMNAQALRIYGAGSLQNQK